MRIQWMVAVAVTGGLALLLATGAWAFPDNARDARANCRDCHTRVAGGTDRAAIGMACEENDECQSPAPRPRPTRYVGTMRCRVCHSNEFECWANSRHARALQCLAPGSSEDLRQAYERMHARTPSTASATWRYDQLRLGKGMSDECLVCHVTGFQRPGGYDPSGAVRNANLAGVGCESCHGPGFDHVAATAETKRERIDVPRDANTCTSCHRAARTPDFDFGAYRANYQACAE